MATYKGLEVPRISMITLGLPKPPDIGYCAIDDEEWNSVSKDGRLPNDVDVCSNIDCADCILSLGDNGKDIYIEFLVEHNHVTKEEALDFLLSLKG